ncbi:MAG: hypothetical protein NTX59_02460 [Elusimicrobia bacterium]|nr:hypothetical protein [Elusimicrobiota bacterium]
MKIRFILSVLLFSAAACSGSRRKDIILTSEPSIERALDKLTSVPEGKQLVDFLYKEPARFEYSNTPGFCPKFSLRARKIFLPAAFRDFDTLLALALGRAAYIYRLYAESGLEDIIVEEEEAAALFQARTAIEMNVLNQDFENKKFAQEIKSDFCTYIFDGSRYAAQKARALALSSDADCQRPFDTLNDQRLWLERIRQSMNEETFFQLLYDRDQQKVRKGLLSRSDAMKNDANIRAMPMYDIYRFQRTFYDKQSDIFSRFEKASRRALEEDKAWNADNAGLIQHAREEFSGCNLPE